jgi:hypothetical protein
MNVVVCRKFVCLIAPLSFFMVCCKPVPIEVDPLDALVLEYEGRAADLVLNKDDAETEQWIEELEAALAKFPMHDKFLQITFYLSDLYRGRSSHEQALSKLAEIIENERSSAIERLEAMRSAFQIARLGNNFKLAQIYTSQFQDRFQPAGGEVPNLIGFIAYNGTIYAEMRPLARRPGRFQPHMYADWKKGPPEQRIQTLVVVQADYIKHLFEGKSVPEATNLPPGWSRHNETVALYSSQILELLSSEYERHGYHYLAKRTNTESKYLFNRFAYYENPHITVGAATAFAKSLFIGDPSLTMGSEKEAEFLLMNIDPAIGLQAIDVLIDAAGRDFERDESKWPAINLLNFSLDYMERNLPNERPPDLRILKAHLYLAKLNVELGMVDEAKAALETFDTFPVNEELSKLRDNLVEDYKKFLR